LIRFPAKLSITAFILALFLISTVHGKVTEKCESDSLCLKNNISGIEREERKKGDHLRKISNTLLFIPREGINTLLYGAGRGAYHLSDPELIERVEDILYIYKHQFGWYPNADLKSDNRPAYGAGIFYRYAHISSYMSGLYTEGNKWKIKGKYAYSFIKKDIVWQMTLRTEVRKDDDRVFYGIGNNPQKDFRNIYNITSDEESAIYHRERNKFSISVAARTSDKLEMEYKNSLINTKILSSDESNTLEKVFTLPYDYLNNNTQRLINEFCLRYDSRESVNLMSSGTRIEGYFGLTHGLTDNYKYRTVLYGMDFISYIPIILNNRFLIPRITLNAVENLNSNTIMRFHDYPTHPTFRGVSTRKYIRTDNIVFVPSLEYSWPLVSVIRAGIFTDILTASESFNKISFDNYAYATGLQLSINSDYNEMASLRVSTGSEGFRVKLFMGINFETNER